MSKAQRLRELETENVALKYEIESLKRNMALMIKKSKATIGNTARVKTFPNHMVKI